MKNNFVTDTMAIVLRLEKRKLSYWSPAHPRRPSGTRSCGPLRRQMVSRTFGKSLKKPPTGWMPGLRSGKELRDKEKPVEWLVTKAGDLWDLTQAAGNLI
jgi:hypothetical protein